MADYQVRLRTIIIEEPFKWRVLKPESPGNAYVGVCDQLAITAECDSEEELRAAAQDSLDLLFKSLTENGDAEEFLAKRGIPFHIEERIIAEHKSPTNGDEGFALYPRVIAAAQQGGSASL